MIEDGGYRAKLPLDREDESPEGPRVQFDEQWAAVLPGGRGNVPRGKKLPMQEGGDCYRKGRILAQRRGRSGLGGVCFGGKGLGQQPQGTATRTSRTKGGDRTSTSTRDS